MVHSVRRPHAGRLRLRPALNVKEEPDFDLLEAQNKELFIGRLAMLGFTGMVLEEIATGSKLF